MRGADLLLKLLGMLARKTAVADLAPDPDGQSDPATMAAGLPYTADDAKAGLLIGRAAKGDVRAAAALAFHGSDGDREWLAKSRSFPSSLVP